MNKWIMAPALLLIVAAPSYAGSGGVTQDGSGYQDVQVTVPTAGTYSIFASDAYPGGYLNEQGSAEAEIGGVDWVIPYPGNYNSKSGPVAEGTYTCTVTVTNNPDGYAGAWLYW